MLSAWNGERERERGKKPHLGFAENTLRLDDFIRLIMWL